MATGVEEGALVTAFEYPSTLCAEFQRTAAAYADEPALRSSDGRLSLTWGEYAERVRRIATGLAALGVGHGDTVALMLTNSPEFHLVDTAALHLGAVPFSIYNTSPAGAVAHQLANSGAAVLVTESRFLPVVTAARAAGATPAHVVIVDDDADDDTLSLSEVERREAPGFDFDEAWRAVSPHDLLTIIYTSGTTGPPKGVELTHLSLLADILAASELVNPNDRHLALSYLPDAHIVNRWLCHYVPMVSGGETVTLANPREVVATLPRVRPTAFFGVPLTWYRIKAAADARLAAEPDAERRALVERAIEVAGEWIALVSADEPVPAELDSAYQEAEREVFAGLRADMGLDRLTAGMAGAAPTAPEVLAFLLGIGLPVNEGFGMSETSAMVTSNVPGRNRLGSVGRPGIGIEVRLADDGELLVRGPIVMRGYRGDPELTAETIDSDGWLRTGDVARIDDDGYVYIVDRKKEMIIGSGGKNMSPSHIEGALRVNLPLAGSVVAVGDNRPFVTALIVLDPDAAAGFARANGIADTSPGELAEHPAVRAAIAAGIERANATLSRVEQVREFTVLGTVWPPGGDELTPTMKLRRRSVSKKYAAEIDALYEKGPSGSLPSNV